MIDRLRIRNLALVEDAELELEPGMVAITGETGAGKSLIIGSVSLLIGERADPADVRAGAGAALVEGTFTLAGAPARRAGELLAEWGVDFDGETVIVRREVHAGGKSRATVNESAVTLAALKRLGEILADLHGQHEHQSLLRPGAGLDLVDRLGGLTAALARYADARDAWLTARAELDRIEHTLSTYAERRDLMLEAVHELDRARLVEGEEEELAREAARLAHADRLRELAGRALALISEGDRAAVDALASAGHAIDQAAALDPSLADLLPTLAEARIAAGEAARTLLGYVASLEADPQALEGVENRRELIARLKRKYRRQVPELIAWAAELGRELAVGEDSEEALGAARAAIERTRAMCLEAGRALSNARRAAAKEWASRLTRELRPLGLPHARLALAVETDADPAGFEATGLDRVEILFTANPGEPERPLQRVVSGGELSRVMLALKSALEAQDRVDVLIFDEVDSGIGGAVAQAVGERLRRLAQHRQVVCVTHLPMIAALATHHLHVVKQVQGGRTVVRIETLEADARVDELARMLAGDRVTSTTRRQARELLGAAPAERR